MITQRGDSLPPDDIFQKIKEILASFRPVHISAKNIQISFLNGNKAFSCNLKGDVARVNFDLTKIEGETDQENVKKIVDMYKDEGYTFIEDNAHRLIEEIEQSEMEHREILGFFKGKLSDEDFKILRLSAYIKTNFDRHKPIDESIRELTARFGDRGKTISHLYSSGYFESHFKPLYEALSESEDFKPEQYLGVFDDLVRDFPYAIFVSKYTSEEELETRIRNTMERNKKYGMKILKIHGIGKENVEKIKRTIVKFSSDTNIRINYVERKYIIDVSIGL